MVEIFFGHELTIHSALKVVTGEILTFVMHILGTLEAIQVHLSWNHGTFSL